MHALLKQLAVWIFLLALGGCSIHPDPQRLSSELFTAARYGHTALAEYLIHQGAIPEWYDADGNSLTSIAAYYKHWDTVDLLLKNKASLMAVDGSGNSLLHLAAFQGNTEEIKKLVHLGIPVDVRNRKNSTPLHLAADGDQIPAVDLLLNLGANINAQNNYGETPLYVSAWTAHQKLFQLLISHHAASALRPGNSETIEDYVKKGGHPDLVPTFALALREQTKANRTKRSVSDGRG